MTNNFALFLNYAIDVLDGKNVQSIFDRVEITDEPELKLGDNAILHLIITWDRFFTTLVAPTMETRYFLSMIFAGCHRAR